MGGCVGSGTGWGTPPSAAGTPGLRSQVRNTHFRGVTSVCKHVLLLFKSLENVNYLHRILRCVPFLCLIYPDKNLTMLK